VPGSRVPPGLPQNRHADRAIHRASFAPRVRPPRSDERQESACLDDGTFDSSRISGVAEENFQSRFPRWVRLGGNAGQFSFGTRDVELLVFPLRQGETGTRSDSGKRRCSECFKVGRSLGAAISRQMKSLLH
jgi:hypothetical protein